MEQSDSQVYALPLTPPRAERGNEAALSPFLQLGWGKEAGGIGVNCAASR
jgi:hypothetical protein